MEVLKNRAYYYSRIPLHYTFRGPSQPRGQTNITTTQERVANSNKLVQYWQRKAASLLQPTE